MSLEERSKYIGVPVTLDGKPAQSLGTARHRAEITTIEKDYEGKHYYLQCPWEEVEKIVKEKGGRFYGGKRMMTFDDRQNIFTGFFVGVATVLIILALIEIFSR